MINITESLLGLFLRINNDISEGFCMMINQKRASLPFTSRILSAACLLLLAGSLVVGYVSYSAFLKVQSEQDNLKSKYSELSLDYTNLQSSLTQLQQNTVSKQSFNELQQTTALIQNQLTDLRSQLNNTESSQNLLLQQHEMFQAQLSNLQTNYSNFLTGYKSLGTLGPFSYLIFSDGKGKYYAENGTTQALDFFGSSGSQVGQECIDALSDSGGKIVFAGIIKLDTPLTIEKGCTNGLLELSGYGPSTQLISNPSSDCIDVVGSNAFGYEGPYHVLIDNLVLTSEISPEGYFMNNGIYVKNWFNVNVENVMVFYADNAGILVEDSANVHLNNVYVEGCSGTEYGGTRPLVGAGFLLRGSKDCYLDQCFSDTNEIGFLFDSNNQTNNFPRNVFLTQCEATLTEKTGVSIADTHGIVLTSLLVEGSKGDGVMIVDSFQPSIVDCILSGNLGNGLFITSESANMSQTQATIKECTLIGNSKNGIEIWAKNGEDISQINIEGSTITNSGTGTRGALDQPDIWDGINISNDAVLGGKCTYVSVTDCFLGNEAGSTLTQKYGVRSLQNSDYVQILNCNFFSNIDGNFTLAGENNIMKDNY
jgi:Right handed beta helix region